MRDAACARTWNRRIEEKTLSQTVSYEDMVRSGPGTLGGRYMRLFWHPVFRAKDLPPGRVRPLKILGEQFTLYRGASGKAYVADFRCAHRGTQLSLGWVEEDSLRCRYHGWKYDAAGKCIEQPGDEHDPARKIAIRSYPTIEYVGLIFAYLGEGVAPPFPRYLDLDNPGVIVTDPPEYVPCNFWNRLDNDLPHIAWTHRSTATRMKQPFMLTPRKEKYEPTDYGYKSTTFAPAAITRVLHWHMPNLVHFSQRSRARNYTQMDLWDRKYVWTVPVDDGKFAAFDVTRTPLTGAEAEKYSAQRRAEQEHEAEMRWDIAEAILRGDMTIEDIPEEVSHYNGFVIEDYATQVGQGIIADRSNEHLGKQDASVAYRRRLWLQELQALAEGRPLRSWPIPNVALHDADVELALESGKTSRSAEKTQS